MALGLIGEKCGMTRVFDGVASIPVTVIKVGSNVVTQLKTLETDGYTAVQVGLVYDADNHTKNKVKASRKSKAEKGHLAKAEVGLTTALKEFRVDSVEGFELGQSVDVTIFEEGAMVDVFGVSKGKGFQGAVKRWNFRTQDATHGNSLSHRAPGSIGQNQTPGRVFKGKKMAGQMGAKACVSQSLQVVSVRPEEGLVLVKGAVPGATGSQVIVKASVKQ